MGSRGWGVGANRGVFDMVAPRESEAGSRSWRQNSDTRHPTADTRFTMTDRPFLILIVLDGFGCRKETEANAIAEADTPRFDRLFRESAWTTLDASGRAVGLPRGQMGNSEVGHLNIGAGRIVDQDIVRIGKAVSRHELEANPTLVDA